MSIMQFNENMPTQVDQLKLPLCTSHRLIGLHINLLHAGQFFMLSLSRLAFSK